MSPVPIAAIRPKNSPPNYAVQIVPTYSANLVSNGDMEVFGGLYGVWGYTVSDGTIIDEATLTHSGGHAAKITAGASVNTHISQYFVVVPGDTYNFSVWMRGDGAHGGRYFLYDASHGYATLLGGTGNVGTTYVQATGSFVAPAGCTSVQLYLQCPSINGGYGYFDDVSLLDGAIELVLNGGFEYINPTGWSNINSAYLSCIADPRTGSLGSKSLSVINEVANYGYAKQNTTLTLNTLVMMLAWTRSLTSGQVTIMRLTGATSFIQKNSAVGVSAWENLIQAGRVDRDNPYIGLWAGHNVATEEYRFDDITLYSMTLLSCLRTQRRTLTGDFIVKQNLRLTAGTWIGFCLNMDSASAPLNFVLAFVDGVNAYLETCLNGTYTRYSVASAWTDNDEFKVTKTGTTYTMYRNNTQLGVPQTINQAAIKDNTLHMQFSTYGSNLFTSPFVCQSI